MHPRYDRILLTGASGAIGAHLFKDILAKSELPVVCVVRSPASADRIRSAIPAGQAGRVSFIVADLTDELQSSQALSAVRRSVRCLAIHCAADVSWTKSERLLGAINRDGARRFAAIAAAASEERSTLVFLSTAFIDEVIGPRNAYEETKAAAEKLLENDFQSVCDLIIVRCSLVVGDARSGAISRFNGVYPLVRVVALREVPCVVAGRDYLVDIVPVDYVAEQIWAGLADLPAAPRRLTLASGDLALPIGDLIDITLARTDLFRAKHGLRQLPGISIISRRQYDFLMAAAGSWDLKARFERVEKISEVMAGYIVHGETGRVIEPKPVSALAPDARAYFERIVDFWLNIHAPRLLADRPVEWLEPQEAGA